jgi:hypothetical protein
VKDGEILLFGFRSERRYVIGEDREGKTMEWTPVRERRVTQGYGELLGKNGEVAWPRRQLRLELNETGFAGQPSFWPC